MSIDIPKSLTSLLVPILWICTCLALPAFSLAQDEPTRFLSVHRGDLVRLSLYELYSWEVFGPVGISEGFVLAMDQAPDGTLSALFTSTPDQPNQLYSIDVTGPTTILIGDLGLADAAALAWAGGDLWIGHGNSVAAFRDGVLQPSSWNLDHPVTALAGIGDLLYAIFDVQGQWQLLRIDVVSGATFHIELPIDYHFEALSVDADFDDQGRLWFRSHHRFPIQGRVTIKTLVLDPPESGRAETVNDQLANQTAFVDASISLSFGPDPVLSVPTLDQLGGGLFIALLAGFALLRLRGLRA